MSSHHRDDFTPNDKRIMAERVSWRCSFPGCGRNTVGPNSEDPTKKINNGIAAHICAAAPSAPRYDPNMSISERKSITNGIWMCREHGNLIDADHTEYSVDTLKDWKLAAEKRSAESLKHSIKEIFPEESTFIQLGSKNVFHATWELVNHRKWSFVLLKPEFGSFDSLKEYILSFGSMPDNESYIVIESQGDARRISDIHLRKSQSGQEILDVEVQDKITPTDPNKYGSSLKLGNDGDLCIEDGTFGMVRGVEAAKQAIATSMGVIKGEIKESEEVGSLASEYYRLFSNNLEILSRLIKLELIRFSLIPVIHKFDKGEPNPSLHFVKRFKSVTIKSKELSNSRFTAFVNLEWGNGEFWSGDVPIFVLQTE